VIAGHSLFSSIAPRLASLLRADGFPIHKVITFAQPNSLANEQLQEYAKLDIYRIIDIRDPASSMFPRYVSVGTEIILLSDRYHTNASGNDLRISLPYENEEALSANLEYHTIQSYIQRIQPKIKDSVLVSFFERMKYS